ncbi:MAG TPA: response regulator [Thermodesulfobacteriota bacterium]|nr:response regulator [Thermodesulfobacteriota bacterium]
MNNGPQPAKFESCRTGRPRGEVSILVVDDDPMTLRAFDSALSRLGYSVTAFLESVEALKTFQEHPDRYDLLLTDQRMPGLEGDRLAEEVIHIRPGMPVILCTGFSNSISAGEAKAKGIRGFLLKPFSLEDLADAVGRVLMENGSCQGREN